MSRHKRTPESKHSQQSIGTGPYLARVVSHFDPTFMGNLEVTLLRRSGNTTGEDTQTYIVRYASPFFGYTAYEYMGNVTGDSDMQEGFSDTQKSYGMWMVPPDVGVTVMVMFVDGDPAQGFYLGCVPDNYANRMVPGIAASDPELYEMDTAHKDKYAPGANVPVGEINRRINGTTREADPKNIKKPAHPVVRWFYEEGLLLDSERGTTTASARRDSPSMVFGISSPGPLHKMDWDGKAGKKGKIGTQDSNVDHWVSRLGGTQFVMDDGDTTQNRVDHPSRGPMEYVDDPDGKRWIPKDELFRVRTRTGHQLLFHNSEDFIYIGNSRGTAWVELSSDGKIDIYGRDSISIHTQNDLNIRADRDINMEAGRNINMKATAEYKQDEHEFGYDGTTNGNLGPDGERTVNLYGDPAFEDMQGFEAGRIQLESQYNMNMLCGRNMKINVRSLENPESGEQNLFVKVVGDMKVSVCDPTDSWDQHDRHDEWNIPEDKSTDMLEGLQIKSHKNTYIQTVDELHVTTEKDAHVVTSKDMHMKQANMNMFSDAHYEETTGDNHTKAGGKILEAGASTHNNSGEIIETGAIHMNGKPAETAEPATPAEATPPEDTDGVLQLAMYENDCTDETLSWSADQFQADPITSIMRRVPMHEPWAQKENLDPLNLKPNKTDREENQ